MGLIYPAYKLTVTENPQNTCPPEEGPSIKYARTEEGGASKCYGNVKGEVVSSRLVCTFFPNII